MKRTASKVPTTPREIAKLRCTVDEADCVPDEAPCVAEEELEEDDSEDAVTDVVPVLLLVCDVEDEVSEGSTTSKLSSYPIDFYLFPEI